MTVTNYLDGIIWRLQLVASFVLHNIFPIASAVMVNGTLFGTTQGEEILQGL